MRTAFATAGAMGGVPGSPTPDGGFVAGELAEQAMLKCGIQPRKFPIRGGTDGSRLSFMGLPCPNLFTGEMSLHSKQEYVSVQDMEKSLAVLIELVQLWEKNASE